MAPPGGPDRGSSANSSDIPARAGGRPLAACDGVGELWPVRLGIRSASGPPPGGAEAPPTRDEFAADDLAAGTRRLAALEISLERVDHVDAATLELRLRNAGPTPIRVEALVLGFEWRGAPAGELRFLRHGWQSWSFTGARPLDGAGEPPFPSGEWLRGMHHALGRSPADRGGWHESAIASVVGCGPDAACAVGVLESGRAFGVVYLRPESGRVRVEVEQLLEVPLAPGETRELEAVRVALDRDATRLLERFAELWGRRAGARTRAPFQAGWCSWYHFFHAVREDDLLRNLEALTQARQAFPIEVVQLDDGYQRAIGDWLETNPKFPRGLEPVARDIRSAGFRAGLWTAPFCAVRDSRIHGEHRDWLLRNPGPLGDDELFLGLMHGEWSADGRVYALDTTRPEVIAHLEGTFRQLVEMGFDYLKLDFLHASAMRATAADPAVTRAERLRRGLAAVRRGAGDDAFLLGCGCPLGPAVGVVDGMRIGPDVAPSWGVSAEHVIPGLEPALPSTASALRSIWHRAWMHRRLWLNDPDCLMVRSEDTQLAPAEVRALAASIAATGGMIVFSDDVPRLSERSRDWLGETLVQARQVDASAGRGVARVEGLLEAGSSRAVVAELGGDALVALVNASEAPGEASCRSHGAVAEPLLDSPPARLVAGALSAELAAHEGALYRVPGARRLVVFCDFDGTFSVQDVGATLARQRLADRRPALWERLTRGELTAWQYNMELLDGVEIPRSDLDAFLETIDLDPGAEALTRWCEKRGVPFRILSDGFDYNLDRLQALHGIRFEYASNRLRYEGDRWRIAAGAPDPRCGCGTGVCKRGRIEAWRREHPDAFCVHVGNGRVSDLCGAAAADWVFAKDTLAPACEERGIAAETFSTLHDVVAALEARFPEARSAA